MPTTTIPYKNTGYFSQLINDYLSEKDSLASFYGEFPTLENFGKQIKLKEKSFSEDHRNELVKQLKNQYKTVEISEATQNNIDLLRKENTFTITTGHQLNLFTGPLYFLYKIFSVINLTEQLSKKYPENKFVPIYWMATEDHDFEEINYFNFSGKKLQWKRKANGAVGEFSTEGLHKVSETFKKQLGNSKNAAELLKLFEQTYLNYTNLAEATRYLGNKLFSEYGLVIVDGNDAELKKAFIPFAEKEFAKKLSFKEVSKTTEKLVKAGYNEQVHPREINLFYLKKDVRERFIEQDGEFYVNEMEVSFTKDEILKELNNHPERFSPNALLRPLYQEVILPNLCYIGGGGELAYWFQLKDYFKSVDVVFPILLLRNSALLVSKQLSEKLKKMDVEMTSLFLPQHELITKHTKQLSEINIDLTKQREHLQNQFKDLYELAEKTDASFLGAVAAQEKKQLNGLDHLEKRLLKAQKRKLANQLDRLTEIQDTLFPNQSLQERTMNFSEFYLEYGEDFLSQLKENLDPLLHEFTILEL